jgi:hypothetical protein
MKPLITGYFIKDLRQYAELSELIGELRSPDKIKEIEEVKMLREDYLVELIKYYQ